jgi:4-amino-4-deoxy-L-arabinose transferase-like glycosyltransferase
MCSSCTGLRESLDGWRLRAYATQRRPSAPIPIFEELCVPSPFTTAPTRWPLLWLICLGLVLGFGFQGARGLWSPDEGRYVDAALQMLDSGDYLAPGYSPDELNFSKPPTTYWVIAASLKVFGRTTWAARAPYALAYLFTLLLLHAMGKRLIPDKPWLPGLIYGCSAFPVIASNIISTDVFLTLCEALAMFGFVSAVFGGGTSPQRRFVLLMWLGWGLAFLTKGPPGLIPLLAVIPFVIYRDGWRGLGRLCPPYGILIFLAVGSSWYAIVIARHPGLLHYFVHDEVYNRLFTGAQRRHAGALGWVKIYLPTLALGLLPWWFGLIRGLRRMLSAGAWKTWKHQPSVELFLLMWFVVPFVVFCLAQSRLPLYLLPLFLPLSLLLALALRDHVDLRRTSQRVGLAAWVVALLAVKGVGAHAMHSSLDNRQAAQQLKAIADPSTYKAAIFVENTELDYTIEEDTPWGLRFYLDKPVYGVPWHAPQGPMKLCHALNATGSALVVIDDIFTLEHLQSAFASCAVRHYTLLGRWRSRTLELIQM